jgi:hypothetical protein
MRNIWKGMVLGALAGAGVGVGLDALEALGREGRTIARQAAGSARDLAADGRDAIVDAHLGERVIDLTDSAREQVEARIDRA